ncbi:PAS domain S-box-containing protein [Halogranum gelatinilyticum]|uniref:histidine kinase n=2 Tax=Halogranum gelatinilyticum TaxID=660521 RepID=A0A1G9YG31_9EURY|nr:PAS domain S-box-containing protein [Halogranum gelatinilyticum]
MSSHPTISESSSVCVLCVDDEPGLAELVGTFLEQAHGSITGVPEERVTEALAYFEEHDVDAIVSDFDMPNLTGLDFLEEIREQDPSVPFILNTGKGSEEIASEAISMGVTEYMQKESGTDQYAVLANRVLNAVEQYRTEQDLQDERARFQAVFKEASDAMIIADDDGTYVDVNSAACDLFDRSEDDLLGKTAADFTDDDFNFDTAWDSFKEERTERGVFPVERPDGTVVVAEYAASANIMDGKHLSVLRDITERREFDRKLSIQKERLNEFAGVLSHDLQNPVQVAQGHVGHLRNGVDDGDRERHLDAISDAVTRIDHVIKDVLAISRENSDSRETTEVELSAIAADIWQRVNPRGTDPEIEPGLVVTADEGRLERLLTNLFRNSIEHGRQAVTVSVGRLTEDAGFFVEDDGPGIPVDTRKAVFDWQHSTKDGGTGIGLKSVEQAAESEGWSVSIAEGTHGGARFEFQTDSPV